MDKWKNKKKSSVYIEDSILPPTRRVGNNNNNNNNLNSTPPLLDKRRPKNKWSIDGFFKKVSSILDAPHSSSSSLEDLSDGQKRKIQGIRESKASSYTQQQGYAPAGTVQRQQGMEALPTVAFRPLQQQQQQQQHQQHNSRGRGVKARAEARLRQFDSSDDGEEDSGGGSGGHFNGENCKKRSRASRTERYLKRTTFNGNKEDLRTINNSDKMTTDMDRSGIVGRNGNAYLIPYREEDGVNENLYANQHHQTDVGVNPLVQQTLQYFSEFDRNMAQQQLLQQQQQQQQRSRKTEQLRTSKPQQQPPKPPSRDRTSRILVNGLALDQYNQQLLRQRQSQYYNDKENGLDGGRSPTMCSPNSVEVRCINEGRARLAASPNGSYVHKLQLPRSPNNSSNSPLRESLNLNKTVIRENVIERNQSPLLDINKSRYIRDQLSPRYSPISPTKEHESPNHSISPHNNLTNKSPNDRRSAKNLEEALCELEAIYNSLQLGDEELLERAEKRTMEEFHYKGFTASPTGFDALDSPSRRKTWCDAALSNYKEEPEVPDRLKDDMAYRRMHPKERPCSVDGQSSLSSISYLMASPIPSRRDDTYNYIDPKRKPRRKEPDVTLDDVVFRSMQYANNTLKVADPQPPFGIPLGPITTATESDYLHTRPTWSERSRSPYIPCGEPDPITDDLAYRSLRKDSSGPGGSRQTSPSSLMLFSSPGPPPTPSSPSFGLRKKRAVRSLSANLYGLINNRPSDTFDSEDQTSVYANSTVDDEELLVPVTRLVNSRIRTSDPEVTTNIVWQNGNGEHQQRGLKVEKMRINNNNSSDLSSRSFDESSDERMPPAQERLTPGDLDVDSKTGSDKASSYLSSSCSTPPPPLPPCREIKPFTEQEINVYRKLCSDLEKLVQMTRSSDIVAEPESPPVSLDAQNDEPEVTSDAPSETKPEDTDEAIDKNSVASDSSIEEILVNEAEMEWKVNELVAEPSPAEAKRELSNILDSLKRPSEDKPRTVSGGSCSQTVETKETKEVEKTKETDKTEEITKETCDATVEVAEKEERRDMLLKDVQSAKLSGDWKESTPKVSTGNGHLVSRRSSGGGVVRGGGVGVSGVGGIDRGHWEGMNKCNHKYNSMPAKTSSLLPFRQYGSKRKSNNRKSMCTIS